MTCAAAVLAVLLQAETLEPWASKAHPADQPKRHVEEIAEARREYAVLQGGTLDGSLCRSPQGVWTPFEQTWESNRFVRLENVGETDVVNPWLSNGRNRFRSMDEIVASAVEPGMSDAEKAMALWWQQVRNRWHWGGDNDELGEPVRIFNVYGHNTCGNDSIALAGLWRRAGLKVAPARLVGHCVSQVFYDGGWHLFDGDMQSMFLLRDNRTVAAEPDLVRDKDLIRRTHTQGILQPERRASDEWHASIYVHGAKPEGDRRSREDGTMAFTLRPGEALTWRWGRLTPAKYHGSLPHRFPDYVCNGLWEYRPDFRRDLWRAGVEKVEAVLGGPDGLAALDGRDGFVQWTVRTPYVIVGGRIQAEGGGAVFAVSADGKTWTDVPAGPLDAHFPPEGPARYDLRLRCRLSGQARLRSLALILDLQMAPLALPEMRIGRNAFTYTDATPGPRKVRVTHAWVERSLSRPPEAPATAVHPPDGGESEGTDVAFAWTPAKDPDGHPVTDYHFELSARPDLRWPLSMSFAKLISKTPDAGKAQYTLPAPGLLAPDTTYYWRVRAKDAGGAWGPWSRTWRFTPRGPSPPLNLSLKEGVLRWAPGPEGRRPARYRVYGSDEMGFSVSDQPYPVSLGATTSLTSPFPANFVAEVVTPEYRIDGARAYYRVVAVDHRGRRSGPSDYVEAPRPFVYTRPPSTAKVGVAFRYAPATTRSLGDLRMRVVNGKETTGFWDIETPRFGLVKGPRWLSLDAATGTISGIPDVAGPSDVEISVVLEREDRALDPEALKWGAEKVIRSGIARSAPAVQRFVLDVAP